MTREERELFEQCKLQLVHIHDVVGRKQFYTTKDLIKKIDIALTIPVVVKQSELLPKRLSNRAYNNAKKMRYEDFVKWWDEQVQVIVYNGLGMVSAN